MIDHATIAVPPPQSNRDRLAEAYIADVRAMGRRRPRLPLDYSRPAPGRFAMLPPPMVTLSSDVPQLVEVVS